MARDDGDRFELKSLHHEAVPAALEKAERYRLLNEPREAESICRDILRVEPDNQAALVTMALSLTDQFPRDLARKFAEAEEVVGRLGGEYERAYYSGILCERRAKAQHGQAVPRSGEASWAWLRRAMEWYDKAEALAPPDNDDPRLRWNACARMIRDYPDIEPEEVTGAAPHLLE